MKQIVKYFGMFAVAAVVSTIMFSSNPVDAAFNLRKFGASCMAIGGTPYYTANAVYNNSTTASMTMLCDAEDTASSLKYNTTYLNLHGYDGSSTNYVYAQACYTTYATSGGGCGALVSSPAGRVQYTLSPAWSTVWTTATANDFGYVYVSLPPKDSTGGISSLRGIWHAGN